MSTVARLVRWDLVTQLRHGFWVAAAFATLPWIGVLLAIDEAQSRALLPAIIFLDLSIIGPLFMAGVYFFEKREGSLRAITVSPVATWQWLTAKLVTLALCGVTVSVGLVLLELGLDAPWGAVLLATVLENLLFVLLGFILAAPTEAFGSFFLRFALFFGVAEIPALAFLGVEHPLYWLLPTQPTVVLLRGAFEGAPAGEMALAAAAQLAWIVAAFTLCLRLFERHVRGRR